MGAGLFGFVYNTLYKRINNPASTKFWLPRLLAGLRKEGGDGPLLPLQAANWDIGDMADAGGATLSDSIKAGWWALVGRDKQTSGTTVIFKDYQPIACPDKPYPHLAMTDVTIQGLNNVAVLANPAVTNRADGYDAVIPIQLGYYAATAGGMGLSQVQMAGRYQLRQCLCAALKSSPAKCTTNPATFGRVKWPSETITGTGDVVVNVADMFIDARIRLRVAGTGAARSLRVEVEQLTARGKTPGSIPALNFDEKKFTIDSSLNHVMTEAYKGQVLKLFGSATAQASIIANLNTTLNDPGNRARIADLLSVRLNGAVNDLMSPVPAGQLPSDASQSVPNDCDRFLFDCTRYSFTNPQSSFFLPSVLANFNAPTLEPFEVNTISVGTIQDPNLGITFNNVQLNNVAVTGFSNIYAPPPNLVFSAVDLNATLTVSSLTNPPVVTVKRNGADVRQQVPLPPLKLTGIFLMQPDGFDPLSGGISITVDRSTLSANVKASGPDADNIQIAIGGIRLAAAYPALHVVVTIDSDFQQMVSAILDTDNVKQKALDGINSKLNESGTISSINAKATDGVRRQVTARLDG